MIGGAIGSRTHRSGTGSKTPPSNSSLDAPPSAPIRSAACSGSRGNPAGRARGSRNASSEEVICALLRDFRKHGEKAVAQVRRKQPAAYLKILVLLVPREHKIEYNNPVKNLSDQQLRP
jgi:hypothetical protein